MSSMLLYVLSQLLSLAGCMILSDGSSNRFLDNLKSPIGKFVWVERASARAPVRLTAF